MLNFARIECVIVCIGLTLSAVSGDKRSGAKATTPVPSAKKQIHHCCAKQSKIADIGHGISGEVFQVDVSQCMRICPRYLYDDPGDPSKPLVQKCMPTSYCHPSSSVLERVSTIQGLKVVEVIDTCDCYSPDVCRRESYVQSLNVGTPYQTRIDVGFCIGSCKKESCRPSRNSTISIVGPNGNEIHQRIEKCTCAADCHRMDFMETILDYSGVEMKKGMMMKEVKPHIKQINVGRCVGTCSSMPTETCLLRDKRNPEICLAGLYTGNHSCSPAKFKVHEYRTRRGMKREIIQIMECACV